MASVLVLGATGYIGGGVARAFRREGAKVYGGTRSSEKAKGLIRDEIIPVIMPDVLDVASYADVIAQCDIIVNCASDYSFSIEGKIIDAAAGAGSGAGSGAGAGKKLFIDTSGILVHGHSDQVVNENTPTNFEGLPPVLKGRIAVEQAVISAKSVDGVVIRPGFVYGHAGGIGGGFFTPVAEGEKLKVPGRKDKRWSWVHVDDLAQAYVRAAQNRGAATGQIFDVGEPHGPQFEELLRAAKGYTGEAEYVPAEGADAFIDANVVVSAVKAATLLGWHPKHTGLVAELDTYRAAINQHRATAGAGGAGAGFGK